jgi:hypothetical protein
MKKAAPAYPKELLLQNDGREACRLVGKYFECPLCIPFFDIRVLNILNHWHRIVA